MMTFPMYGKIKHVPNHQPENNGECDLTNKHSGKTISTIDLMHIYDVFLK